MGLVAWRLRDSTGSVEPASVVLGTADEVEATESAVDARAGATIATPMPREPEALAEWLPEQACAAFLWHGQAVTRIGREDAPLLVIVEREPSDEPPLSGPAAELFERMLGAIGKSSADTCQCVLASSAERGAECLLELAQPTRPVSLVLVRELDGSLDAAGCRLPGRQLGGDTWCLPHPDVLLANPAAKRQAWLVMKAVRQHLPLLP